MNGAPMTITMCMVFRDAQKWQHGQFLIQNTCRYLETTLAATRLLGRSQEDERDFFDKTFEQGLRSIYPLEAADKPCWR